MIIDFGFYFLRRPIKEIDRLVNFHNRLAERPFEDLLREWYKDPVMQEAIMIASCSLHGRMQSWLQGDSLTEKGQLLLTLYKYLIRSCTRCTPYGLFALCAVGTIEDTSAIDLDNDKFLVHAVPDMEWSLALSNWLATHSLLKDQILLFPNSSLYSAGNGLRYIEQSGLSEKEYFISSLELDDALESILKKSDNGASTRELVDVLVGKGYDPEDAAEYVNQLIEDRILEFNTKINITGKPYLANVLSKLAMVQDIGDIHASLSMLQADLGVQTDGTTRLPFLRQKIKDFDIAPGISHILKVDSFFSPKRNHLSKSIVEKIHENVSNLFVLSQKHNSPELESFKREFRNRYEDAEISLAVALDNEMGIGFGMDPNNISGNCPLLGDLVISNSKKNVFSTDTWWLQFIFEKYCASLKDNLKEIVLSDSDLKLIEKHNSVDGPVRRPSSFYLFANIFAHSLDQADKGNFLVNLLACKGPSAINMLCRFAEGSPQLSEYLKRCVEADEHFHPDIIFAELAHFPESRAGNIAGRPNLHKYEIPYLCQSSVSHDFRIQVEDLMISVHQNEIILRSKRLNKRVIPRISNVHNYRQGVPMYRFLCELQNQDAHLYIKWDWGVLDKQAYLPRVRYKNIIISRQTWLLRSSELSTENNVVLRKEIIELGLPDVFNIVSGDNELFIKPAVEESLRLFSSMLRKHEFVTIMECLMTTENCVISKDLEHFHSEFVIPFFNTCATPIAGYSRPVSSSPTRVFDFGSEWLYLKVYLGEKSVDHLLSKTIYPIVKRLIGSGLIRQFFFVRYKDSGPHLRLRFQGNPKQKFHLAVLDEIHRVLQFDVSAGIIRKIQTDTYQREIERYGYGEIALCESFFCHDSMETLSFFELPEILPDEILRFELAIRKIDRIMVYANLTLEERRNLTKKLSEGFVTEFNGGTALRKSMNRKYEIFKKRIPDIINEIESDHVIAQIQILKRLEETNLNKSKLHSIIASLIHMAMNRVFCSNQRQYEMLVYHCVYKYYDSIYARSKRTLNFQN